MRKPSEYEYMRNSDERETFKKDFRKKEIKNENGANV